MTTPIDTCDACEVVDMPTPVAIDNRPGLSEIQYRVGTYGTFRQAMLRAIQRGQLVKICPTCGTASPPTTITCPKCGTSLISVTTERRAVLKSWTVRRDDDFGIALFDMWAYILDILTFYQERIANEAYLNTAVLPESLRRLTGLINYVPSPGKAASVYLAFLLQPPTPSLLETTLTPRLRVQSMPGPNEKPQKFETEDRRLARAAWNQLAPVRFQSQPLFTGKQSLYLKGRQTSIKPGDALLLVGDEKLADPDNDNWDFRVISDVVLHSTQTEVRWTEGLGTSSTQPAALNPKAYILRSRASLFGFNAPLQPQTFSVTSTYSTSGGTTTVTGTVNASPATPQDWTFTRPEAGQPVIYLDAQYPKLVVGQWVALNLAGTQTELYFVNETSTEYYAAYSLNGKVTRAKLDGSENLDQFYSSGAVRKTEVWFGQQEFEIDVMPVDDPLLHAGGQTIKIEGEEPDLDVGRPLVIKGPVDGTGEIKGEIAEIAAVLADNGITELTLSDPLTNTYALDTVEIYANVLYATHGETTNEVLGSGDAAQAFQSFTLKKAPVTYVPQAGAPNGAASTLQLRVNDVLWQAVASFYGHMPVETIYTARIEESKHVVRGGDGQTGQHFPTGKNNITATYRVGIGETGNVKEKVLTTLLDRPAGVKKVINPLAAEGGADPEPPDQVRTNAPNTVRTFGRIVSLRDFEDSARQYAGIAKARAEQVWNGDEQLVRLTVARDHGDPLTIGGTLYNELLDDLDSRRDPNRAMELQDYTQRPVIVQAKIYIDVPTYLPDVVYEDALDAITDLFDFANLNLGQTVHLSEVMATLQHVPGVVAVDVDRFIFKCPDSMTALERISFYEDRQALGAPLLTTLGADGCPTEGHDVQDFAGAFSNELIVLENPDTDLSLTPVSGIKGTQL
jgi:ribosomal protein L40E